MQNRRGRERTRPRVGERAEDERAGEDDDDRGERAHADARRRIDDLPAALGDRTDRGSGALDDTERTPRDERRLGVVDCSDDGAARRRHHHRVAEVDEIVVRVAGAGQPDTAMEHFELAAGGAERQDAAALEQLEVTATKP